MSITDPLLALFIIPSSLWTHFYSLSGNKALIETITDYMAVKDGTGITD